MVVVVVVVTTEEEGSVVYSFQVSAVSYQKFIDLLLMKPNGMPFKPLGLCRHNYYLCAYESLLFVLLRYMSKFWIPIGLFRSGVFVFVLGQVKLLARSCTMSIVELWLWFWKLFYENENGAFLFDIFKLQLVGCLLLHIAID